MEAIDWTVAATLIERDDSGSDLHYHFRKLREGPLGELVRAVAAMPAAERARLVLEMTGGKTLNVGEILALAQRRDLP
ncbi:MAG TPA: hypothetical protein VHG29_11015 [Novosphingobium sp.]|nr:hypothetical protein [Novosphingobium sp.]